MPLSPLAKTALQYLRDEYELDPESPTMDLETLAEEMSVAAHELYMLEQEHTDSIAKVETGALMELVEANLIYIDRDRRHPPDFTARIEDTKIIWPGEEMVDEAGEVVRPFDVTIGRLDRVLSEVVNYSREAAALDDPDRQTLKHHAEDMIAAGEAMLKNLGKVKGTPQPNAKGLQNDTQGCDDNGRCG